MENLNNGEVELIFSDLKRETEEVMQEITDMEDILVKMKESIETGQINRDNLLEQIKFMRDKIGLIEHLDTEEFEEEKSGANLMTKLKGMIDKCI